jgi:metal-responsive CopG/Arc/MetJ family transcriptional regulator
MATTISISFRTDLLNKIDKKRGMISRSKFVNKLLESAMVDQEVDFGN